MIEKRPLLSFAALDTGFRARHERFRADWFYRNQFALRRPHYTLCVHSRPAIGLKYYLI